MWKNIVQPVRPHITKWRVRIAYWLPKAKITHSEYIIISFPLQQWLHGRAPVLRYRYNVCLVDSVFCAYFKYFILLLYFVICVFVLCCFSYVSFRYWLRTLIIIIELLYFYCNLYYYTCYRLYAGYLQLYYYYHHHHHLLYAGYLHLYPWDKLCP